MRDIRGSLISMIFQEPMTCLNPSMRCGDQILESVRLHCRLSAAEALGTVFSLIKEVRLPAEREFYRKYPHQLSGGQRQRIMIAMALAGNPRILIADEPTTALDVVVQRKILDLLQELRMKRRMGLLFISHDLGVIRSVCDKALVMYRGKIVESGTISSLFRRPEHPYTRGLVACRPVPGQNPHRLPTLKEYLQTAEAMNHSPEARQSPDSPGDFRGRAINKPDHVPKGFTGQKGVAPPLLEARELQVEFPLAKNLWGTPVRNLRAVDHFSFRVDEGETLGLIGESGCGKSTLGRSLIRLIRSRTGEIYYRGTAVSSLKGRDLRRFRQKVQFIFQDPYSSLNPRMTIGHSIMEVMKVHGIYSKKPERQKATIELLKSVGLLPNYFERYPHEFSGGQRQRIGLARALAAGPELLICDESVSSLDVSVQAMILNLLNDLKEAFRLTYIFISHDLSVVRYMSDRILVMKEGRLIEEGESENVFSHPSNPYTRELADSVLN